jgi:hypothetical protein
MSRYGQPNGQALPVFMLFKVAGLRSKIAVISSYELRFRCSSVCLTRMDEGYNTMVLDLYFIIMENFNFSILQMAKSGGCSSGGLLYVAKEPTLSG